MSAVINWAGRWDDAVFLGGGGRKWPGPLDLIWEEGYGRVDEALMSWHVEVVVVVGGGNKPVER